jgi:hypothetical protein
VKMLGSLGMDAVTCDRGGESTNEVCQPRDGGSIQAPGQTRNGSSGVLTTTFSVSVPHSNARLNPASEFLQDLRG